MTLTLSHLLEGRDPPLCVDGPTKLKTALALMIEYDFSQLPVIDEGGKLLGVVTDQAVVRAHFHSDGQGLLSDLTVEQCRVQAETLPPDYDLVQALDRMKSAAFVLVVEDKKPIGIITYFDTTNYFKKFSEGLMLVQDIELTLRDHIETAFPSDAARTAALFHAFGHDRRDSTRPAQLYEEMTLHEHVQFITTERNWPRFNGVFEPKALFQSLMEPVVAARNQLVHFRGELSVVQLDALNLGATWAKNCLTHVSTQQAALQQVMIPASAALGSEGGGLQVNGGVLPTGQSVRRGGKYGPLADWLEQRDPTVTELRITFDDVEKLLGDSLPPFASRRNWWANERASRSQSLAWLSAGWRVRSVDFTNREVTFQRTADSIEGDEGTL